MYGVCVLKSYLMCGSCVTVWGARVVESERTRIRSLFLTIQYLSVPESSNVIPPITAHVLTLSSFPSHLCTGSRRRTENFWPRHPSTGKPRYVKGVCVCRLAKK
jgi:hypothetical protein